MKFFQKYNAIIGCIFLFSFAYADVNDEANKALDNLKSIWDGATGFVSGLIQSTGLWVPDDYRYSFKVFNDSPGTIGAVTQNWSKVLGAGFAGNITQAQPLGPYTNSGDYFLNQHLYFTIWVLKDNTVDYSGYKKKVEDYENIGKAFLFIGKGVVDFVAGIRTTVELDKYSLYSKNITIPIDKKYVNFYRAYTYHGKVQGEFLGIKTTTNQFMGLFYNSSDTDVSLKFTKDSIDYQATLEANTFNVLNSTEGVVGSIRPATDTEKQRAFIFLQDSKVLAALPIASEGICNVQEDPPGSKKLVPGSPMVYTYEVSKGSTGLEVSMQGLAIGNYDQPVGKTDKTKNVTRDINPLQCHAWYQSAKQVLEANKNDKNADPTQHAQDYAGQMWIFYKTKNYTYQKKITPGQVIDFTLLRPMLSEKNAWMYIVTLLTTDDAKSLKFLNRLADGIIGQDVGKVVTPVINFNESTVLTKIQPNTRGIIDDTQGNGSSGVKGYALVVDSVKPRGVGIGPFYYVIKPAIAHLDQLIDLFGAYIKNYTFIDLKKSLNLTDLQAEILKKIEQWLALYATNKTLVATQVTEYLQEKGIDAIMTPEKKLNDDGKKAVETLVSGPVSIGIYPLQQQAGTNEYVYNFGEKPEDWPTK